MIIRNLALISTLVVAALHVSTLSGLAGDAIESTNCNQTDGQEQKVHTQISSYRIRDLAASRNNFTGISTRNAGVWLYGKVSGENHLGKKALVIWNFSKDNDANKNFPKCEFQSSDTIKITIPYGYWQMPALLNLLSTMGSHGIACSYGSKADKSASTAVCVQNAIVKLPYAKTAEIMERGTNIELQY